MSQLLKGNMTLNENSQLLKGNMTLNENSQLKY